MAAKNREGKFSSQMGLELQAWFMEDPTERELQLKAVGFLMDSIRKIRYNRATDKFLIQHKVKLETLTGLNMDEVLVRAVKRALWDKEDKLPGITTRAQAVSALCQIAPGNYHLLEPHLHFGGGRRRFETFVADPSKLWAVRLAGVLSVLAAPPQVSAAKPARGVQPSAALPRPSRTSSAAVAAEDGVSAVRIEHSRKVFDSCIAVITSTGRILENGVDDLSHIPDDAKLNFCSAVNALVGKLGINFHQLKELRHRQLTPAGSTENLGLVLGLFGSKKK